MSKLNELVALEKALLNVKTDEEAMAIQDEIMDLKDSMDFEVEFPDFTN